MTTTMLGQIRQLDEQRAALVEQAKEEALAQATAAVEMLNDLGCRYELVLDGQSQKKSARAGNRKARADKDCPICLFQTDPPHDARHHRSQVEKAPFTVDEMDKKEMSRIGNPAVAVSDVEADVNSWEFGETETVETPEAA